MEISKSRLWAFAYGFGCFLDMFNALALFKLKSDWIPDLFVGTLALLVMTMPERKWPLILLSSAFTVNTIWHHPHILNSNLILALVGLAIVGESLINAVKKQTSTDCWSPRTLSAIRLVFLLCYAAAALSKWNSAFFDSKLSCAVSLPIFGVHSIFPWLNLSPSQLWFMPAFVATSEALVVVLLAVPGLRRFGVAWAILFHLAVSFAPGVPGISFTGIIVASVLLFAPNEAAEWIISRCRPVFFATRFKRALWTSLLVAYATASMALAHFGYLQMSGFSFKYVISQAIIWGLGLLVILSLYATRQVPMSPRPFGIAGWHYPLAVLILFVGAEPYLGIGNAPALTMFSNLQTYNGQSNHFFIPRANLSHNEDGLIRLHLDDGRSLLLTKYAFGKFVQTAPLGSKLRYSIHGKMHSYLITAEARARVNAGWLSYKLFDTSPADPRCGWKG